MAIHQIRKIFNFAKNTQNLYKFAYMQVDLLQKIGSVINTKIELENDMGNADRCIFKDREQT